MLRESLSLFTRPRPRFDSDYNRATEVRIAYESHRPVNAPYRVGRTRRLHPVEMTISTFILLAMRYPVVDKQLTGYLGVRITSRGQALD